MIKFILIKCGCGWVGVSEGERVRVFQIINMNAFNLPPLKRAMALYQ